jgi:hypothetical protein
MCGSDACLFHQRLIACAVGRFCFFGQHTPVGAAEGCESDISASTGSPPLAAPTKKLIAIHIVAIF